MSKKCRFFYYKCIGHANHYCYTEVVEFANSSSKQLFYIAFDIWKNHKTWILTNSLERQKVNYEIIIRGTQWWTNLSALHIIKFTIKNCLHACLFALRKLKCMP